MKKLISLSVCVVMLSSCGNLTQNETLKAENDSLSIALANRDAELDNIMAAFNEVQEGFRLINEAENRVDLQSGALEGTSASQKIKDDIRFISEKLKSNREQIAKLEEQLKNSKYNSAQLKKAIANLNEELQARTQQIETLQTELASKNIRIAELDDAVAGLTQNVADLVAENEVKSATVASQDKALNTAWFVFGTKSELKEQKIIESKFLQKTKVLSDVDFNKDYFTQIDIRTDKEIKLYSKDADLLTTHPAGSYELVKDEKGQLTLKITKPAQFWSVSRYLVILVKKKEIRERGHQTMPPLSYSLTHQPSFHVASFGTEFHTHLYQFSFVFLERGGIIFLVNLLQGIFSFSVDRLPLSQLITQYGFQTFYSIIFSAFKSRCNAGCFSHLSSSFSIAKPLISPYVFQNKIRK